MTIAQSGPRWKGYWFFPYKCADNASMIEYQDVQAAAVRLQGQLLDTPCVASKTLSDITGAQVFLKFENLQFTAAYKERGALNKLLSLTDEERGRGVIAASAALAPSARTKPSSAPERVATSKPF